MYPDLWTDCIGLQAKLKSGATFLIGGATYNIEFRAWVAPDMAIRIFEIRSYLEIRPYIKSKPKRKLFTYMSRPENPTAIPKIAHYGPKKWKVNPKLSQNQKLELKKT